MDPVVMTIFGKGVWWFMESSGGIWDRFRINIHLYIGHTAMTSIPSPSCRHSCGTESRRNFAWNCSQNQAVRAQVDIRARTRTGAVRQCWHQLCTECWPCCELFRDDGDKIQQNPWAAPWVYPQPFVLMELLKSWTKLGLWMDGTWCPLIL